MKYLLQWWDTGNAVSDDAPLWPVRWRPPRKMVRVEIRTSDMQWVERGARAVVEIGREKIRKRVLNIVDLQSGAVLRCDFFELLPTWANFPPEDFRNLVGRTLERHRQ